MPPSNRLQPRNEPAGGRVGSRRRGIAIGRTGVSISVALVLVLAFVVGGNPFRSGSITSPEDAEAGATIAQQCDGGTDAAWQQDCRVMAYAGSAQAYWAMRLPQYGSRYQPARLMLFAEATETGCGVASAQTGPVYCPTDMTVFLELGFFEELRGHLGAQSEPYAEAYVVGHAVAHHIQHQTGVLDATRHDRSTGPDSTAVRIELQADCFTGVWVHHAVAVGDLAPLTREAARAGLDAAGAVGDARVEEPAEGRVTPEDWTHGSAEDRQRWFFIGYESGDPARCDTFS